MIFSIKLKKKEFYHDFEFGFSGKTWNFKFQISKIKIDLKFWKFEIYIPNIVLIFLEFYENFIAKRDLHLIITKIRKNIVHKSKCRVLIRFI